MKSIGRSLKICLWHAKCLQFRWCLHLQLPLEPDFISLPSLAPAMHSRSGYAKLVFTVVPLRSLTLPQVSFFLPIFWLATSHPSAKTEQIMSLITKKGVSDLFNVKMQHFYKCIGPWLLVIPGYMQTMIHKLNMPESNGSLCGIGKQKKITW